MDSEAFPGLTHLYDVVQQLYGNRTITENLSGAFSTTNDKCLDFFSSVVRDTTVSTVISQFIEAWNEDPDKAVKLLLNLRDIREGKGEKMLSLVLMFTLSCWKPLTYLANMKHFLHVGCYKDLLVIAELSVRCKDARIKFFDRIPQLEGERVELMYMAGQLKKDEENLPAEESEEGFDMVKKKRSITLCAKWAPTEDTRYDLKPLRFGRKITKMLGIKKKEYRQMLSKLRNYLRVLERKMCNNEWDQIVFESIPAKAHKLYREAFKRDMNAKRLESEEREELSLRYVEYLAKLAAGKTTIKSTGLQPHELVRAYLDNAIFNEKTLELDAAPVDETIEGQWNDLVKKLSLEGSFKRVQAVCDVSGSMAGEPMEAAIALGLVVAELADEPFKNKLITFHENPKFHTIKGSTLRDKVSDLQNMEWGGNTNLVRVFQVLLDEVVKNPGAQMVEKLFIFSDMQFDEADATEWTTTHQVIKEMYSAKGVQVPLLIFWNLRATDSSYPVDKAEDGTALVSGFSAQLMKTFLRASVFNPVDMMDAALKDYKPGETFAPVPQAERTQFPMESWYTDSFRRVEKVVAEFIVPKTKDKKRKRGGYSGPGNGDESYSGDEDFELVDDVKVDEESGDVDCGIEKDVES